MRKDVLISLLSVKGVMYERMEGRIGCDPPKYIHNPIFNLKNRSIFKKIECPCTKAYWVYCRRGKCIFRVIIYAEMSRYFVKHIIYFRRNRDQWAFEPFNL